MVHRRPAHGHDILGVGDGAEELAQAALRRHAGQMTPLASILVAAHPALAAPDLEQRLDALLAAAPRAWPAVRCDGAQSLAPLAAELASDGDVARAFAALHATDLYLAFACAQGIAAAVTTFEREHLSHMSGWIARVDGTPDFVDEVRQRLRE